MNRFLSALLLLSSLAHAEDSWDFNGKDKSEAVVKAKSDPDAKVFLAQGSSGSVSDFSASTPKPLASHSSTTG